MEDKMILRFKHFMVLTAICLLSIGCQRSISVNVIDAETEKPVENAVIMAEWTDTKGLGLSHTESYKVVEVLTDAAGRATITGPLNPFVSPARFVAYKKGYVLWSKNYIFPEYVKRTDFRWEDDYTIKLERFKLVYTYIDHTSFISSECSSSFGDKKLINDVVYWEHLKASKERDRISIK
jgi:hypothetical protein